MVSRSIRDIRFLGLSGTFWVICDIRFLRTIMVILGYFGLSGLFWVIRVIRVIWVISVIRVIRVIWVYVLLLPVRHVNSHDSPALASSQRVPTNHGYQSY